MDNKAENDRAMRFAFRKQFLEAIEKNDIESVKRLIEEDNTYVFRDKGEPSFFLFVDKIIEYKNNKGILLENKENVINLGILKAKSNPKTKKELIYQLNQCKYQIEEKSKGCVIL